MRTRSLMIGALILIATALWTPWVHAEEEEEPRTLYMRIKKQVELEMHAEEAELAVQRLAVGLYHDSELETIADGGDLGDYNVPLRIPDEAWADMSIRSEFRKMCGSDPALKNYYAVCLQAQDQIRRIIERNAWIRRLGRGLQLIASGYESGIDGYPGRPIDVIPRFSSITHLWRASNDPFVHPLVEVLTKAEPYPDGVEDQIEEKANEVIGILEGYIRTWEEKKDTTEKDAAIWRYRHGVHYVIKQEGPCEDAPEFPEDPAKIWLERRWCELEDKLKEIRDLLGSRPDEGNEEHIIFPSIIRKPENIFIWMRKDDVGLQWYIPIEPLQAALYHPDYGDCLAGDSPANCYDVYFEFLVRGGEYPKKIPPEEGTPEEDDLGALVPEPKEKEGICSHPFSKRGYLCRQVEYEACDITNKQREKLKEFEEGNQTEEQEENNKGIILTQCQPERFKDDVARKLSGPDICGIGGWRDEVKENLVEDTPDQQLDMVVNKCAACAIDVVCNSQEPCFRDEDQFAATRIIKRNGVVEICMPSGLNDPTGYYYLLAHEMVHAMQVCNGSDLEAIERLGGGYPPEIGIPACCSFEREAYFAQCKLYAIDGVLDKVGITIDQCASALANGSCKHWDDDPDDDDYVCTNDNIDPKTIGDAIAATRAEMLADGTLEVPSTCEAAMQHPRIKAIYNSIPLACEPGCESLYDNTIGNNLCYTGQCIEQMHERGKPIPGRISYNLLDQDNFKDGSIRSDPKIGQFEAPPAITSPKFPLYQPEFLVQELDHALCQINGLPARTPPVICAYDELKRLGLSPEEYTQSANDLVLQPKQYEATGLGIQYSAAGIGSRLTSDMFTQYLKAASRQYTDLLNMTYHIFKQTEEVSFPSRMCERYNS